MASWSAAAPTASIDPLLSGTSSTSAEGPIYSNSALDSMSDKPAQRFLVGVSLALFGLLMLCMIFLVRPMILNAIRRLRSQQAAVEVIIQRKRRRRKPLLHEIWLDDSVGDDHDNERTPLLAGDKLWNDYRPFSTSIEHSCPQNALSTNSASATANMHQQQQPQRRCLATGSGTPSPASRCDVESPCSCIESPPSLYEQKELSIEAEEYQRVTVAARVCVLISMPSPTRSARFRLPSLPPNPSLSSLPPSSTIKIPSRPPSTTPLGVEGDHLPDTFQSRTDSWHGHSCTTLDRRRLPTDLAVGVATSSLNLYE